MGFGLGRGIITCSKVLSTGWDVRFLSVTQLAEGAYLPGLSAVSVSNNFVLLSRAV
jgi:hypothetical protein